MGTSLPSKQPSAMASQYHATAFQPSMNNGFPQTDQYSLEETLAKMLRPQDTFMTGGNQDHSNNFGHQTYMAAGQPPYPDDAVDPHYLVYTPMPVPPMPDENNIDPHLEMLGAGVAGGMNLGLDGTQGYSGLIK